MYKVAKGRVLNRERKGGQEICVRLLDHSDYDAVMSVSDSIYHGLDYIPHRFHWLLDTGGAYMCLLYVDDKAVSFAMAYIIDDGENYVGMAARTLPQYQGKGYLKILKRTLENLILNTLPEKRMLVAVTYSEDQEDTALSNGNVVAQWNNLGFNSTLDILSSIIQDNQEHIVHEISPEEAVTLFQNKENLNIFKSKRFAACSLRMPYKVNIQNVTKVAQESLVFVTLSAIEPHGKEITAITFASSTGVPLGVQLHVYYFGASDMDVYEQHVRKALGRLQQCHGGETTIKAVQCSLHFPKQFNIESVVNCIEKYDLAKTKPVYNQVNIANYNQVQKSML